MAHAIPRVELVLCRHSESIDWALNLARQLPGLLALVVYNNGAPLQSSLNATTLSLLDERSIPNVGREAYCYVRHLQSVRQLAASGGLTSVSEVLVFSQATPSCYELANLHGGHKDLRQTLNMCERRRMQQVMAIAQARSVDLLPWGFVDLERTVIAWNSGATELDAKSGTGPTCWRSELRNATGGEIDISSTTALWLLQYAPWSQFAVTRANVLATPAGWLEHTRHVLERSASSSSSTKPTPRSSASATLAQHRSVSLVTDPRASLKTRERERRMCCLAGRTCLPWILERLWGVMLLGSAPDGAGSKPLAHRFRMSQLSTLRRATSAMQHDMYETLLAAIRWAGRAQERAGLPQRHVAAAAERIERNLTWWAHGEERRLGCRNCGMAARHLRRWVADPRLRRHAETACLSVTQNVTLLRAAIPRIELSSVTAGVTSPHPRGHHRGAEGRAGQSEPGAGEQKPASHAHLSRLHSALQWLYGSCVALEVQGNYRLHRSLDLLGGARSLALAST